MTSRLHTIVALAVWVVPIVDEAKELVTLVVEVEVEVDVLGTSAIEVVVGLIPVAESTVIFPIIFVW